MQIAFKMKLNPGCMEEYKKRHDKIWPELKALLKEAGIRKYAIFLDEETHILFAVQEKEPEGHTSDIASHPVMRRWWDYMADIMETNADHSPVTVPLVQVFDLQ
jgi:L-rhamnose mutarotase